MTKQCGRPGAINLASAAMVAGLAFFTGMSPARAFCVENRTGTRLFFTARLKGEADKALIIRQWVEGGASACAAPERGPGILEIFVFADEDAVEGCDDEIAAAGTLRLSKFEEFDRCSWGK